MTSETDKNIPGLGGKDDRPRTTLDLTATEIPIVEAPRDPEPKAQAALPPGERAQPDDALSPGEQPSQPSGEHDVSANGGSLEPGVPRPAAGEAGIGSFLTHMAAGSLGAMLALVIAFYALGNFRDRLPLLTDHAARDLRGSLSTADQRIGALEQAGKAPGAASQTFEASLQALQSETNGLKQDVASLGSRVQGIESQPAQAAVTSLEGVQQSLQPITVKIGEVETRLASLAKAQDDLRASTAKAALALAAQNLRRAVSEGKPYAMELKAAMVLAPASMNLAALEARQGSGVASLPKLQRDFDIAARAAIEVSRRPGDGSFAGDLLAKARSLVRIRPTGDIPGNTADAILARAELRLKTGDIAAAIRETAQLEGPAAEALQPWLAEAKARIAADETLTQLEATLISALGTVERAKRGG